MSSTMMPSAIPCSCAASMASAICLAMGSASSDRPARHPLPEILTLDQLHDEGLHSAALLEPVDVTDVRMIQRRERLRLAAGTARAVQDHLQTFEAEL